MTALGVLNRLIGRSGGRKTSRRSKAQPSPRSLSRGRNGTRKAGHSTRLPPELIFEILSLAASPSPALSAERAHLARRAQLATLSLVCKSVNRWAQDRLYTHPVLKQGDIMPFTRVVKKNAALAAKVRTITAVGTGACTPTSSDVDEDEDDELAATRNEDGDPRSMRHLGRLRHLLDLCPSLVHLEMCGILSRALLDLDGGRQLQSITFRDCLIVDVTTTSRYHKDFLRFPNVTSIALVRTSLDATTTALLLSAGSFPNLRSLSLSHSNEIEDTHSRMRLGPLQPRSLWPLVSQLALDGIAPDELAALEWDRMANVEELSVPMKALDSVPFEHLTKLSHLRLVEHPPSARALINPSGADTLTAHLDGAKSLLALMDPDYPLESLGCRLGHVTVPAEWRDRPEFGEPGPMRRTLERLGRACRREGLAIRFDDRRSKPRREGWRLKGRQVGGHIWEPEVSVW